MSFVSALWLLLLHAVSGATALPIRDVVRAPSHAVEHAVETHAVETATVVAELGARIVSMPARVPEESVRAPLGAANTLLARVERALSHGGLNELPPASRTATPGTAGATRRVLLRAGHEAHRLASRGSHLPYYPTAPPAQV